MLSGDAGLSGILAAEAMSWRRRRGAAAAAALLMLSVAAAGASNVYQAAGVTRHADGDTFYLKKDGECFSSPQLRLSLAEHAIPIINFGVYRKPQECRRC